MPANNPKVVAAHDAIAQAEAANVDISIITTLIQDVVAIKTKPGIGTVGKLVTDVGSLIVGLAGASS